MIDPDPKSYAAPEDFAAQRPDPASSHGMMLEMIGADKRVVEFGCADGYMSRWLRAAGCRVTGVEVDPAMAAKARDVCDEVVVADLDVRRLVDLLPGSTFDVAVFGDVLEHLRDPWRVLDESRSLLTDGGFVVISIPNVAHGNVRLALLRGSFDYQRLGLLDDTHLRFFTAKTVRELCLRAGYRIERLERTKAALFAPTDTMPQLDPTAFDPALVAEIARDPEHDTFQFVLRAVPLSDRDRLSELVAGHSAASAKLAAATSEITELRSELARVQQLADMQTEQEFLLIERSIALDKEVRENQRLRARIMELDGEIDNLRQVLAAEELRAQEAGEALRKAVALFLEHANAELEAVRVQTAQLNRTIERTQASVIWSVKLRISALRNRLRPRNTQATENRQD